MEELKPLIKAQILEMKRVLILAGLFLTTLISAQDFKTHTYFIQDSLELELDLFVPKNQGPAKTPLVIYVHGGGFSGGDRTAGHQLARYLASQNIACASISYTLYMKNKSFSCDGILTEKIRAIQLAVSQLWLATDYLIDLEDELNIDSNKIFIAGSSAGAETVLHASFWDREQMQLFEQKLYPEFKYAGAISGAGAIMDLNLITDINKIPVMLFHGDNDSLVPYATAAHHFCSPNSSGWLMLFGSYSVAQHLESLDGTSQLITFQGGGHNYAGAYFHQNQQPVVDFINKVLSNEKFIIYQTISSK